MRASASFIAIYGGHFYITIFEQLQADDEDEDRLRPSLASSMMLDGYS